MQTKPCSMCYHKPLIIFLFFEKMLCLLFLKTVKVQYAFLLYTHLIDDNIIFLKLKLSYSWLYFSTILSYDYKSYFKLSTKIFQTNHVKLYRRMLNFLFVSFMLLSLLLIFWTFRN